MLDMNIVWNISVDTAQLNMLCRALRGVTRESERESAAQLAEVLAGQRVTLVKNKLEGVEKLENNLKK